MERTKLTVRVPKQYLDGAKRYAAEHETSMTRLITEYLRRLDAEQDDFEDAPIVRRLAGSLPQSVSEEDYRTYIDNKYGD